MSANNETEEKSNAPAEAAPTADAEQPAASNAAAVAAVETPKTLPRLHQDYPIPSKMKGLTLTAYSEEDPVSNVKLCDDLPVPTPGSNEVLIKVCAASMNPVDYKICMGWMQTFLRVKLPHIIGRDCAGIIVAVGSKVNKVKYKIGMRVAAQVGHFAKIGTFCEYTTIPAANVFEMSPSINFVDAASLVLAGQTSYQALVDKGKFKKGNKVLILGGASGCGVLAIQIAKALGAGEIAVTSSQEEFCKQFGATRVFNYKKYDETKPDENTEHCWYLALKGENYDIIYDCVGGKDAWQLGSTNVLHGKGHFVTIVGDNKHGAALTVGRFLDDGLGMGGRKFWNLVGNYPNYDHFLMDPRKGLDQLFDMFEKKQLVAVLDEASPFTLEQYDKMLKKSIERKAHGKLVLSIANDDNQDKQDSKEAESKEDANKQDDAAVDPAVSADAEKVVEETEAAQGTQETAAEQAADENGVTQEVNDS